MKKLQKLFLRITNKAAYIALLECERLEKEYEIARRWHKKSSDILENLVFMRKVLKEFKR